MKKLNLLLEIPGIENELFDFKGQGKPASNIVPTISNDICAFANTEGGTMILGIEAIRDPNVHTAIRYEKNGYDIETEDRIGLDLSHQFNNVDPIPKYATKQLYEGSKYFIVIKISSEELKKPYFERNSCKCYVRVGSSSEPASRSTVINLFSGLRKRIEDVDRLRVNTEAAKGSLVLTSGLIRSATGESADTLPPVDLTFLRNAVLQAEWFLREKELLGAIYVNGYVQGMYSLMLELDRMNNYIEGYNRFPHPNDKEKLKKYLEPWKEDHMNMNHILEFLNKVVVQCEAFMKEKGG